MVLVYQVFINYKTSIININASSTLRRRNTYDRKKIYLLCTSRAPKHQKYKEYKDINTLKNIYKYS
jgi:hypothetical protein